VLGSSVGPYQILERLGAGGMGEVFLGHDPRLERRVALKCLTSAISLTADGHTRVLREARAIARLTHPNIAGVYDVLEQDGRAFIVMEYVEGVSLSAHLAKGALPAAEVRLIGRQLASALAAAHAQGVIHRDLKPANIQVMRDGSIKVLDFGVARLMPTPAASVDTTLAEAAAVHSLGGNPGTAIYMAPEQLIGHIADARTDIYSAGVILFQMATGRRPYPETTAVTLALAMNAGPPAAAHDINPLVPPELSDAVAKALKRNPAERYQSAHELDAALAASSGTSSGTRAVVEDAGAAGSTRAPFFRRHAWKLTVAAVVLLTIGVLSMTPLPRTWSASAPAVGSATGPVLAILPIDNPTGDPQAAHLATAIASAVATSFRAAAPLKVLSQDATAPFAGRRHESAEMKSTFGSSYVLDLTIRRAGPPVDIVVRLVKTDDGAAVWQETLSGPPVQIERRLIDGVARAVRERPWWRPAASTDEGWSAPPGKLPTESNAALIAYAEAAALLERQDLPERLQRAIVRLQAALDADRNFALGYAALASALLNVYERTKDEALIERATGAVNAALRLDAALSATQFAQGYLQYVTDRRQEAAASLQRAIQLDPDNDAARRLLGWRLLAGQGRFDDAVAELRQAVRIRPDAFDNHYRLGNVLYLGGRYQDAAEAYRRAIEILPMRADAYTNLGATYHMLGDVSQAIGNYEHAIALGADNAKAYGNLAVAYFISGRPLEALKLSRQAVARDPNRASLQRDLGDYLLALHQTAEARAAYSRAIELARRSLKVNARDVGAVIIIAVSAAHLGDRREAEGRAAEALTLAPADRDILIMAAKTYLILGDRSASLGRLRAAIERGYNPELARADPELSALKASPAFEEAIAAGMSARSGDRSRQP